MGILITIEDVRANVRAGMYDEPRRPESTREKAETYVFDENKSVKENREMVEAYNKQVKLNLMQYHNDCAQKYQDFKNDLIAAIQNDYNFNPVQAEVIYNEAYDDGHSYGYEEVINYAGYYIDFVLKFLDATPGVRE